MVRNKKNYVKKATSKNHEIMPLSNNSTSQIAEDMYGKYVVIEKESDGAVILNDKWLDNLKK